MKNMRDRLNKLQVMNILVVWTRDGKLVNKWERKTKQMTRDGKLVKEKEQ